MADLNSLHRLLGLINKVDSGEDVPEGTAADIVTPKPSMYKMGSQSSTFPVDENASMPEEQLAPMYTPADSAKAPDQINNLSGGLQSLMTQGTLGSHGPVGSGKSVPNYNPETDTYKDKSTDAENPSRVPQMETPDESNEMIRRILTPTKTGKAAPSQINLDVGTGSINTQENLRKAEELKNQNVLTNQLGKAGELIGTAISGAKPVATPIFDENIKQAGAPLEAFKLASEQEKSDPNSPLSKSFKQFLTKFGVNVKGDFTAAMGEKLLPLAVKAFEAEEGRKSKEAMFSEGAKNRALIYQQGMQQKEEKAIESDKQKMGQATNFDKQARGNAAQVKEIIISADKIKAALDLLPKDKKGEPDFNQASEFQKQELVRQLDRILTGRATVSGQKELMGSVNSIYDRAALVRQYLTGKRAPTNTYDLVKQLVDTVDKERDLAQEKVKDMSYDAGIAFDRLRKKDPQFWENMLIEKAEMHPVDLELRKKGFKSSNILNLMNKGMDKEAILKAANEGKKPQDLLKEVGKAGKISSSGEKTVVKKGYNPSTDQTQLIYSDGSSEILSGRQ